MKRKKPKLKLPRYIRENIPLASLTTFRTGGKARCLSFPVNTAELLETLALAKKLSLPVRVLGGGSNLLVADRGVNAMVVRLSDAGEFGEIAADDADGNDGVFRVGAAVPLAALVAETARRGRAGLSSFAGIPGRVGGAVAMNAGGAGAEGGIGVFVRGALAYTPEGEERVLDASELGFSYRHSTFSNLEGSETKLIATSFCFAFPDADDPARLEQAARECAERKRSTQPLGLPSAGCIFRNPPDASAGALLDAAGCKGMEQGGARVSDVHANFIVTNGKATTVEIAMLAGRMRKAVEAHSGVHLEPEVVFWSRI